MSNEFKECAMCAAKPGTPLLCGSCLHNRKVIYDLSNRVKELESEVNATKPKPTIVGLYFVSERSDGALSDKLIARWDGDHWRTYSDDRVADGRIVKWSGPLVPCEQIEYLQRAAAQAEILNPRC